MFWGVWRCLGRCGKHGSVPVLPAPREAWAGAPQTCAFPVGNKTKTRGAARASKLGQHRERSVAMYFARPWKAPRPPWRPVAAAVEESPRLRWSIWRQGVSPAFLLIDDSFIRWHKYWCPYQCLWSGGVATLICTFCRRSKLRLERRIEYPQ